MPVIRGTDVGRIVPAGTGAVCQGSAGRRSSAGRCGRTAHAGLPELHAVRGDMPADVHTDRIVVAARAELARKGKLNPIKKLVFKTVMHRPRLLNLAARLGALAQRYFYIDNPFAELLVPRMTGYEDKHFPELSPHQFMDRWPETVSPLNGKPKMRVGYFVGCATNLIFTGVGDATIRVLRRNGIEAVIPRNQSCCGIPVYASGDFKTARKLAENNKRIFDGLDVDCIITDCASCSSALKHEVHDFLDIEITGIPVYDLTEFLANVIELDRNFGEVPMKVTYHDPCHLGRGQGIYSEPRDLLKMVPGVEFIEMTDADRCCGGAGSFAYTHHGLSRTVGARKAASIRDTGAEYVATPCPSCRMQIEDLLIHEGSSAGLIHPVEILDLAYEMGASQKKKEPAEAEKV